MLGCLIACGAIVASHGCPSSRPETSIPGNTAADKARTLPLVMPPRVERLLAVSAAQREWIRQQIQPPAKGKATSSYCLHLLRVHGLHGKFQHRDMSSSEAVLRLLTDDRFGQAYFGLPAIVRTRSGFRFPTRDVESGQRDRALEEHRDHTLAALGELGIPLSYPLSIQGEQVPLREVLRDSVANFHLKQKELPWTALAYTLFLPPEKEWTNRYGERYSFDDVAEELRGVSLEQASCGGTHLLYTLTIMARVDQQIPILSEAVRSRLREFLRRAVGVVVRTQRPEGSWHPGWNNELLPGSAPRAWTLKDEPEQCLLLAGHLAEWMLYLPQELQPPPEVLRRAGLWLHQRFLAATADDKERLICPYSHAACALRQMIFVSEEKPASQPAADD
jgi:hypothetical protein